MLQCVKDCNRKFTNEAALSRYRKTCSVLETVHQRFHKLRRGGVIRGSGQKDSTLLSCKERLQVSSYQLNILLYFMYCYSRHTMHAQRLPLWTWTRLQQWRWTIK